MNPHVFRAPRPRAVRVPARLAAFALGALAAAVAAPDALAKLPSPANSTVPAHINLVGASATGIDPCGEYDVVVRDLANDLQAGTIVVLDFSRATDVRLATDPVEPGAFRDCPTRTIRAYTDMSGVARFRVVGASTGAAPSTFAPEVDVYADGVFLGTIRASTFDLDGQNGVGGADNSIWLGDFGAGGNAARSDYDGDGVVGGADLAIWLGAFGGSASLESGAGYCP